MATEKLKLKGPLPQKPDVPLMAALMAGQLTAGAKARPRKAVLVVAVAKVVATEAAPVSVIFIRRLRVSVVVA